MFLPLSSGRFAIIDDQDFDWLSQYLWTYKPQNGKRNGYAYRTVYHGRNLKRTYIWMHRAIVGDVPEKMEVDHINGNGLDNRRSNLRIATPSQNCQNRCYRHNSTGFKGVTFRRTGRHRNRFHAAIRVDGRSKHLGSFATGEQASAAYGRASKMFFGEFSKNDRE